MAGHLNPPPSSLLKIHIWLEIAIKGGVICQTPRVRACEALLVASEVRFTTMPNNTRVITSDNNVAKQQKRERERGALHATRFMRHRE